MKKKRIWITASITAILVIVVILVAFFCMSSTTQVYEGTLI